MTEEDEVINWVLTESLAYTPESGFSNRDFSSSLDIHKVRDKIIALKNNNIVATVTRNYPLGNYVLLISIHSGDNTHEFRLTAKEK